MKRLSILLLPLILSACVTTGSNNPNQQAYGYQQYGQQPQGQYIQQGIVYGKVLSIRDTSIQLSNSNGNNNQIAGAVIGGVVGGLLGNQVGRGTGKTLATVAGVAGGAWAGNELAKNGQQPQQSVVPGYEIQIQDNNTGRVFVVNQVRELGYFYQGDRVRVETDSNGNSKVTRY